MAWLTKLAGSLVTFESSQKGNIANRTRKNSKIDPYVINLELLTFKIKKNSKIVIKEAAFNLVFVCKLGSAILKGTW